MSFVNRFFEDGNINTILGNPKEGKTNLAVWFGFNVIKYGYTVLSNIAFFKPESISIAKERGWLDKDKKYLLQPEKFKYIPLASKLILEASKGDKNVVMIDEAGISVSSSRALSEGVVQMKFLGYSIRKIGACLIIIAQSKGSIVPVLRKELVDYEVHILKQPDDRRDIQFLKSHRYYSEDKGDYDVKFLKHGPPWINVPLAPVAYDTRHPGGFKWDIDLRSFYDEIALSGYDSVEVKEHIPRIINNIVAEKKIDEFMKKKKFMRTGSVAEFLKVSDVTIRNWADDGIINCIKDEKGRRLFSRSEVTRVAIEKGLL